MFRILIPLPYYYGIKSTLFYTFCYSIVICAKIKNAESHICIDFQRFRMVPGTGIEPALPCGNQILSLARLPIPPSGRF
jgi:hypothetical protein